MNRKELKRQNLLQLFLFVANVIVICYIASVLFFRVDMTQEKRFTLSETRKQILKSLPDEILVKVYLSGDMPLSFKRLNKATHEMLDEFRVYAGKNLQYQFVDVYDNPAPKVVNDKVNELYKKGLQPTNIKIQDPKGGYSEKLIIPGALISYNSIELPVNLLSNNPGLPGEENLNNSIQDLEYNFINKIQTISNTKLEKIAFLEGHGELDQEHVADISHEMANYYQVDRGKINGNVHALDPYKCVIIAQPENAFSEEDKFVLDQYLMKGGKIAWFISPIRVNQDSIANGRAFAYILSLNIDDQLFKYGIRINPALVQDVQCNIIPVNTSLTASQPKFVPAPWLYYPLVLGSQLYPVSRNLNMVKTEYCSYIDTLAANSKLQKKILLSSSKYSRVRLMPGFISLAEIKQQYQRTDFDKSFLPIAALVEGRFPSVFKNRMLTNLKIKGQFNYIDESVFTKMLVVADGNIIRNDVRYSPKGALITPLGFDRYTSQTFGNKEFVLNAINYMTNDIGLMQLRSKQIRLRLLDKSKIQDERLKWQIVNVLAPVILIVLAGFAINFWRKRKYAS